MEQLLFATAAFCMFLCSARLAVRLLFPPRAEARAGKPAERMATGLAHLKEAEKAAVAFVLAKSWDQAGSAYLKMANCYQKFGATDAALANFSVDRAARAYVSAANCYKKTNFEESISCLEQAANLFLGDGRLDKCATRYMEIAELYETVKNFDQAVLYYERAADLFYIKEDTKSLIECRRKVAQFAAQLENYEKSIEVYEDLARQLLRNNRNSEARKFLLCAGVCKLCKGEGDVVAINNALKHYKDLDPTFSDTREYRLLVNLADAVDQVDVAEFSKAVKEYESVNFRRTQQDALALTLLSRLKEVLNAKELGDANLS